MATSTPPRVSSSDAEKVAASEIDNVDIKMAPHEEYADLPPVASLELSGIPSSSISTIIGTRYMAAFFITTGGFMAQPVTLAWLANQMGGHYKRSIGSAVQIGFGNLGGIVASNIFLKKEEPHYPVGFGTALGFLGLTIVTSTIFYIGLRLENKKRDSGGRDYRYEDVSEVTNLGDDHPTFRYTY